MIKKQIMAHIGRFSFSLHGTKRTLLTRFSCSSAGDTLEHLPISSWQSYFQVGSCYTRIALIRLGSTSTRAKTHLYIFNHEKEYLQYTSSMNQMSMVLQIYKVILPFSIQSPNRSNANSTPNQCYTH